MDEFGFCFLFTIYLPLIQKLWKQVFFISIISDFYFQKYQSLAVSKITQIYRNFTEPFYWEEQNKQFKKCSSIQIDDLANLEMHRSLLLILDIFKKFCVSLQDDKTGSLSNKQLKVSSCLSFFKYFNTSFLTCDHQFCRLLRWHLFELLWLLYLITGHFSDDVIREGNYMASATSRGNDPNKDKTLECKLLFVKKNVGNFLWKNGPPMLLE